VTAPDLDAERKVQLKRISQLRERRDILVMRSDMTKSIPNVSNALDFSDILPSKTTVSSERQSVRRNNRDARRIAEVQRTSCVKYVPDTKAWEW